MLYGNSSHYLLDNFKDKYNLKDMDSETNRINIPYFSYEEAFKACKDRAESALKDYKERFGATVKQTITEDNIINEITEIDSEHLFFLDMFIQIISGNVQEYLVEKIR